MSKRSIVVVNYQWHVVRSCSARDVRYLLVNLHKYVVFYICPAILKHFNLTKNVTANHNNFALCVRMINLR